MAGPINLTPDVRDSIFGPLEVASTYGRDGVRFVESPPLVPVPVGPHSVVVHYLAAKSLAAIARDLERAGLLGEVTEIVGYQPRLVRTAGGGNKPRLSAHAYGAAVDVNFSRLPQGEHTDDRQASLAPYFERHGWYWGENFETPDPHHFAFQGRDPLVRSPRRRRPAVRTTEKTAARGSLVWAAVAAGVAWWGAKRWL